MTQLPPGDMYGGLPATQVPAPLDGYAVGDPSVSVLAGFAQAVLNARGQAAYAAVFPPVTGLATTPGGRLSSPVVRRAFTRDPEDEEFSEADLPAVYAWRRGSAKTPYWLAEDYRVSEHEIVLLYLFPPVPQATRTLVHAFVNAVVKLLDAGIESMRDPAYVAPGDPDPTAATTQPAQAAVKVAVTTSTTKQTYSGAALDGQVGGRAFAPAQQPTVTVAGVAGQGTVVFTGVGSDGALRVSRVALSGQGVFSGDFPLSQVQQVDVPAQQAGGSLEFGLGGFQGLGTQILWAGDPRQAPTVQAVQGQILERLQPALMSCEISKWRQYRWTVDMAGGAPRRSYPHAVEVTLAVQERWFRYVPFAGPAPVVVAQFPTATPPDEGQASNAEVRETAQYS